MAFIVIDLQGKQTAGGYLRVDGGGAIALSDDMSIFLEEGTHCIEFSSQSPTDRGLANFNAAVGNYRTAAWAEKDAIDGKITEYFSEKSVMYLTIISDARGKIVDVPTYTMEEKSDDIYDKMCEIHNSRIDAQLDHEKKTAGIEFLLCLLLGYFGVHKFYRGKIGMGILYLFTAGLFGIGWFIDIFVLLFKWLRVKFS